VQIAGRANAKGGLAVNLPASKGWFYLLLWLSVAAIAGTIYIVEVF
jgi:hypothetical protein